MGYSPRGHKESDTTERLHFHFLNCIWMTTPCVTLYPWSCSLHLGSVDQLVDSTDVYLWRVSFYMGCEQGVWVLYNLLP